MPLPRPRARLVTRALHLYLGLALGAWLSLMGLTGAVLSFKEPMEAALSPRMVLATPPASAGAARVPLEQVIAAARARHPGETVQGVRFPASPDRALVVRTSGPDPARWRRRECFVDPYTGGYQGSRVWGTDFITGAYELHMTLLLREPGERVNGLLALGASVLLLTGLVLWWPATWRQARVRLSVQQGASSRRRAHDLHNVVGVFALPLLLLLALTGAVFSYHGAFQDALYRLTDSRPPARPSVSAAPPDAAAYPLDGLLRAATAAVPDGRPSYLALPSKPGDAARVTLETPETGATGRIVTAHLHPATGALLAVEDSDTNPARRTDRLVPALHFGRWGGFGSHFLYALVGLAPAALFGTGLYKWSATRRAQATNRARRTTRR